MDPEAYVKLHENEDTHWWHCGRRVILANVLKSISIPSSANILEIGCGTGGNLAMLAEFGNVCGIEMEPLAADIARKKAPTGIRIIESAYPPPPEHSTTYTSQQSYDIICMFDVLEHIDDDLTAVKTAVSGLTPSGYFIFTVPACAYLWGRHDIFNHHKRRYSIKEAQLLMERAGLEIEKITYFNMMMFPIAAVVRLWEHYFIDSSSNQLPYGQKMPWKIVNSILLTAFKCEKHILNLTNLPFELSILGVCRIAPVHTTGDEP